MKRTTKNAKVISFAFPVPVIKQKREGGLHPAFACESKKRVSLSWAHLCEGGEKHLIVGEAMYAHANIPRFGTPRLSRQGKAFCVQGRYCLKHERCSSRQYNDLRRLQSSEYHRSSELSNNHGFWLFKSQAVLILGTDKYLVCGSPDSGGRST